MKPCHRPKTGYFLTLSELFFPWSSSSLGPHSQQVIILIFKFSFPCLSQGASYLSMFWVRGPPHSHLLVCGCHSVASLLPFLCLLPIPRVGRPPQVGTPLGWHSQALPGHSTHMESHHSEYQAHRKLPGMGWGEDLQSPAPPEQLHLSLPQRQSHGSLSHTFWVRRIEVCLYKSCQAAD